MIRKILKFSRQFYGDKKLIMESGEEKKNKIDCDSRIINIYISHADVVSICSSKTGEKVWKKKGISEKW